MAESQEDNIASEHVSHNHHTSYHDDAELDKYLQHFDKVGAISEELTGIKESFAHCRHNDDRVFKLLEFANKSDQLNQELITLLIEMNNIFGKST